VQPKNVTFPTDAKLVNRAREKLVTLAKKLGVELRQSYARVGKFALVKHQRYAHARQFDRAGRPCASSRPISAASSATLPARSTATLRWRPRSPR
jgi:IS5 family transposase